MWMKTRKEPKEEEFSTVISKGNKKKMNAKQKASSSNKIANHFSVGKKQPWH